MSCWLPGTQELVLVPSTNGHPLCTNQRFHHLSRQALFLASEIWIFHSVVPGTRHVHGMNSHVADALSRATIDVISEGVDYTPWLPASRVPLMYKPDKNLRMLFSGQMVSCYSATFPLANLGQLFLLGRRKVFDLIHGLSHPSACHKTTRGSHVFLGWPTQTGWYLCQGQRPLPNLRSSGTLSQQYQPSQSSDTHLATMHHIRSSYSSDNKIHFCSVAGGRGLCYIVTDNFQPYITMLSILFLHTHTIVLGRKRNISFLSSTTFPATTSFI